MKRKILWMLLSFLLVAALVLASCAKEEVVEEEEEEEEVVEEEEEEEEEEVVVPPVGVPQYGGTLTLAAVHYGSVTADALEVKGGTVDYIAPVIDFLVIGGVEKYGPRGTNEYSFQQRWSVPERVMTGNLAESWEVTPDKIVYHIRPGIYWAAMGKEHVMETRELTAEDVAWSLNRFREGIPGSWFVPPEWVKSIYAEDNTVVIETHYLHMDWMFRTGMGFCNQIYAREMIDAGASDWGNLVGTGPWLLTEHIEESAFIYERNPIYWDTTIINGVEYEIPFADKLVYPVIPDEATRVAALRTGKLDLMRELSLRFADTLARTSPDLIQRRVRSADMYHIVLRNTAEYLDSREIRRALMIGMDRKTVARAQFGEAEIYGWPLSVELGGIYTPIDELPPETRLLFDYNPELARQMIADAGYPEGFELTWLGGAGGDAGGVVLGELPALIKDMWKDIGVELTLTPMDTAAYGALIFSREGYDLHYKPVTNVKPFDALGQFYYGDGPGGEAVYNNPRFDELFDKARGIIDVHARDAIFKELAVMVIADVPHIPIGAPLILMCNWPWVMNYYGEMEDGNSSFGHIAARIWLDLDLKAELGF